MSLSPSKQRIGTTALSRQHFLLLYLAMLVAAAGNTALQSVMPAIGREIGISDFWVAIAYTWSAVLWVLLAPTWAEKSDHHGRKALTLVGLTGFVVSMFLCGLALHFGLVGVVSGTATFILFGIFRAIYGSLGSATPSATQAYLAAKTRRSGRVAALSALSSSFGLAGPLFAFSLIGLLVFVSVFLGLPNDRYDRRAGRGAAMSYPGIASQPTGASIIAATSPRRSAVRLKWSDRRVRPWILSGIAAGHAQAASLTCVGFFIIDRLHLQPHGAEGSIAIAMMAGASATLAAQWGLIPRLGLGPRALIISGALIAAVGLAGTMFANDLYGITLGFALSSLGFGFTRPGFTGGASLAVSMAEQGSVAGMITSANGISYVAAPGLGMALYLANPNLPFALCALLLVGLALMAGRALPKL